MLVVLSMYVALAMFQSYRLVGVLFREIYVTLAIFQSYRDLEAKAQRYNEIVYTVSPQNWNP